MGILQDKIAIITGGARGQGASEARLFVAEGAQVILTDLDTVAGEALAAELGGNAAFQRHDVANRADWDMIADFARKRFGRVDILINNAGITSYESVQAISPAQMQRYLDIHLFGALHGIQTITPLMTAGGSVVNIASTAALRGMGGYIGYGVSKWALRGLTRYAAHDLVDQKVRVNTVLPGGVDTPMLNQAAGAELIDAARNAVPMRRFASADELARTVLFLASDQSSYMTGAEMVVDGGLNA